MVDIQPLGPSAPFHTQLGEQVGPIALVEPIYVPQDKQEEFEKIWREDALYFRVQPGYLSTQLHKGIGNSEMYINVARWESTQALANAFSPEFQAGCGKYPEGVIAYPHIVQPMSLDGICVA